ncbi:MAG: gamma-glutamylcyclotransferase [Hyphomicrobiales bacterium]|nr:gamma-glutamylcyclotransferase [Hyphomicrobiales bacterium]
MSDFTYFAYGSNMLTARLRERCPSAMAVGRAYASGYRQTFDKLGRDGSGKATIVADAFGRVDGVLFRISARDLPALDRAEWGYLRQDEFPVTKLECSAQILAVTYIAPPEICRSGLAPFDWYLELVRAGEREHKSPDDNTESLPTFDTIPDSDRARASRMFSLSRNNES